MSKGNRTAAPASRPSDDAIAKRAYELFLQRGSVPGHEVDDWLEAEAELIALQQTQPAPSRADGHGPPAPSERRPARERGATRRLYRPHHSQ